MEERRLTRGAFSSVSGVARAGGGAGLPRARLQEANAAKSGLGSCLAGHFWERVVGTEAAGT